MLLFAGIVANLVVFRHVWLVVIGDVLIISDPLHSADAVVPLASDRDRVVYAAELFNQGYANWFVATQTSVNVPGIRTTYSDLVRREAVWQGVPAERFLVTEQLAATTYDEAVAVRSLAQKYGWNTIIIVTSPYHTRRSRMIFRDVLVGTNIDVAVRPVPQHWYQSDTWWQHPPSLRATWTEYLKLLMHSIGYE